MAIRSFKHLKIQIFFETGVLPKKCPWGNLQKVVKRKLDMLHFAKTISDLKVPPNNKLEKLLGNLEGFYSIRINDQWRIIFRWDVAPKDIDIIDYH